jgi:hypothetical protein
MDAAAKVAQEEARNTAKNAKKSGTDAPKKAEPAAKEEPKKEPEPPRMGGLFDRPPEALTTDTVAAQLTAASPSDTAKLSTAKSQSEEEEEILAEIAEEDSG